MSRKYKPVILLLIGVIVLISLMISFSEDGSETQKNKEVHIVRDAMGILNKVKNEEIIFIHVYSFSYSFNKLTGLSNQDVRAIKNMITENPDLEIHGSKDMGISFIFSINRIGLYKEKVSGYIYFSKGLLTSSEKFNQLNAESKFEYKTVGNNVYSFSYEQHRDLFYHH